MDICRSFSFINLNIPPRMKASIKPADCGWREYVSVGFFDGMNTKLLAVEDALSALWLYNEELALTLDGTYSFQNIFGFRSVESAEQDSEFWSLKTDRSYPLTFVIFLQMQPTNSRQAIRQQLRILEDRFQEEADRLQNVFRFACYVTMDKNDFVVCLKSKVYGPVASSILRVHNELNLRILYSYSVPCLNRLWLQELAKDETLFPVDGMEDEELDSISLKGITNSVTDGKLEYKYQDLCRCLDQFLFQGTGQSHDSALYDILGDYDFHYIARNVSLKQLLLTIAKENGPLNYMGTQLRFSLFSSNLVLGSHSGSGNVSDFPRRFTQETVDNELLAMDKRTDSPLCQELMKELEAQIEVSRQNLNDQVFSSLERSARVSSEVALCKILSSLSALESSPTRKYDFLSLYWPCHMLTGMLKNVKPEAWCNPKLFGLIHGLSSTLHGTLRTDIQFFQINDFNAIVHYPPAKLRAFYSAWTFELTQCYRSIHVLSESDLKREYEFAIIPNTNSVVQTYLFDLSPDEHDATEYYKNGNSRLMRIEIPERYLYQPKNICIHLAHETAHFVGTGIRLRPERHEQFLAVLGAALASQFCTDICTCLAKTEKTEMGKLFKVFLLLAQDKLCTDIKDALKEIITKISQEDGIEDIWRNEHVVSGVFCRYAETAVTMLLERPLRPLDSAKTIERSGRGWCASRIRSLCVDFRSYARKQWTGTQEDFDSSMILFVQFTDDITSSQYSRLFSQFLTSYGEPRLIRKLMDIFRETQADIVSIMALRLTPHQYLQSFFQSGLTIDSAKIGLNLKLRLFYVLAALQRGCRAGQLPALAEKGWSQNFFGNETDDNTMFWAPEYRVLKVRLEELKNQISPTVCTNLVVLPILGIVNNSKDIIAPLSGAFAFSSQYAGERILAYLSSCIDAIREGMDADTNSSVTTLKQISGIYERICSDHVLNVVEEIDRMLFEYERKRCDGGNPPCS